MPIQLMGEAPKPASETGAEGRAKEGSQSAEQGEAGVGREGCAVDGPGVIGGDVEELRVGGGEGDGALVVADLLLRAALEVAGGLGALAEDLHGLEDVLRLVVVGGAEGGGPGEVLVHEGEDLGEGGEALDAGIPGLGVGADGEVEGVGGELGAAPAVGVGDLRGVGGGGEDLGDEGVGIEGDGSDELLELLGGEALRGGLVIGWGIGLWVSRLLGVLRLRVLLLAGGYCGLALWLVVGLWAGRSRAPAGRARRPGSREGGEGR